MKLVIPLVVMSSLCAPHRVLPTTTIQIKERSVVVEVADDGEKRARGLMYRKSLPANDGMLFVYPDEQPRSFWMKNVRFPLSIAFVDQAGTIVSISDMKPMSEQHTLSGDPAMYAIEMNEGWFREQGIVAGDRVSALPPPSKR